MRDQEPLDPITVEVIRNYYQSAAHAMKNLLIRGSFSPVVYEMLDFSLGLYTRQAELIAEGPGMPSFMGTMTFAIRSVIDYLGEANLRDGDVILSTYPYWTGSHAQDAVLIRPIFVEGELFGYAATKAHWEDIGAMDVYCVDTKDIWQEGLQVYGAKIHKAGKPDPELLEIIRANTRFPDTVLGDMNTQIAACNFGATKVVELVRKYGKRNVQLAIDRILDHGERITRQAIAAMPDGEWSAEGAMDSDGISDTPFKVKLTIRVQGDEIVMDTTGSAPQQVGPTNCPYPSTASVARLILKMLTTPLYAANGGCFRPLKVIAPEGSVFNPKAPAPTFLYGWPAHVLGELAFKALAEAVPGSVVARSGGDLNGYTLSGVGDDGEPFVCIENEAVGHGASHDRDGENALILFCGGESRNIPIEVLEARYPILVEKYALRQDSGGAGKFRGGLGVEKFARFVGGSDLRFLTIVEQSKFPPWGLHGGKSAPANLGVLNENTPGERRLGKIGGYPVFKGDTWRNYTGGGGGWGDPMERDSAAVLQDAIGGYVSPASAREDYGVVIDSVDGELSVDATATHALRRQQ